MLQRCAENSSNGPPLPCSPCVCVCVCVCARVRVSVAQVKLYHEILRSKEVATLLSGSGASGDCVLTTITSLRKLCNHPDLLNADSDTDKSCSDVFPSLLSATLPASCCRCHHGSGPAPLVAGAALFNSSLVHLWEGQNQVAHAPSNVGEWWRSS
jgi:hypothetical protein